MQRNYSRSIITIFLIFIMAFSYGCQSKQSFKSKIQQITDSQKTQNTETIILDNGFNSGDLAGMKCSGNCPIFDRQTISKTGYTANFILTPDMATNYRTEVTLNEKGKFNFNQDYWFSFRYNYVDWKKDSSAEISPFQVHPTPGSWDKKCKIGSEYSTGPLMMVVKNDETKFVTYGGKALWAGPIKKQQWQKLVVHYRPSMNDDGLVEAWIDGIKLGKVTGANSPKSDNCGNPMKASYLKLGIYKWDWKRKKTNSTRKQLLINDVKIISGKNGLALIGS